VPHSISLEWNENKNKPVIFSAAHTFPAVSSTQASLESAMRNELWYVKSGTVSEQGPPCPYRSSKSVITSTACSAVSERSKPNLGTLTWKIQLNSTIKQHNNEQRIHCDCYQWERWSTIMLTPVTMKCIVNTRQQ